MSQIIFKQVGYKYASSQLEGVSLAKQIAEASPKFVELKADDPIKLDIKAGIIQRVAENNAGQIEAFMIYSKDADTYLSVDDAKFKAHKGEKFHRSVGYIVSMLTSKNDYAKVTDKAKRKAIFDAREPVRKYSNNVMHRLEGAVKDVLNPSDRGNGKPTEAFKVWSDNELKGIEARRLTSEGRGDIVPPKDWLEKEVLTPARAKLKDWYVKNA